MKQFVLVAPKIDKHKACVSSVVHTNEADLVIGRGFGGQLFRAMSKRTRKYEVKSEPNSITSEPMKISIPVSPMLSLEPLTAAGGTLGAAPWATDSVVTA